MKRRWSAFAVFAALALGVACARHAAPEPAGLAVRLAVARTGGIEVTVPAFGRLGPSAGTQAKLSFTVPGRIASIDVHVGESVVAGEALAVLDTTTYALAAQQASAQAAAARAQAQAASIDRVSTRIALDDQTLARERRLFTAGIAAKKDVEAARAQLALDRADAATFLASRSAAQATARSAEALSASARRDVTNATLTAPADGIVTAVYHSAGESVDPSIAVIALAPRRTSSVSLQVAGSDAARVKAGDAVRLRVGANATPVEGRVLGVGGALDPATQSVGIAVEARVPNALSGSAVNADVVVAHDRGILVPHDAIVADPATGKTLLFVESRDARGNAVFAARSVRVVFQNATDAEVTGLRAGERIAAEGAFELLAPSNAGG